jgi:N6-adenosine-specific RNA methylase IME4
MTLDGLPRGHYGAILADPPWHFESWTTARWNGDKVRPVLTPAKAPPYPTMDVDDIAALAVRELAAADSALFCWGAWYRLPDTLKVISAWGFEYKTCAFCWMKADVRQPDLFETNYNGQWGLGYWVRQNSEFCLLATRGKPSRLNADVMQGIIAPRRQHSRKPDGIHERIERLVAGPYLELFARQRRPGWDCWGNEVDKFAPQVSRETPADSWADMWAKPFDFSKEPQP